MGMMVNPRLMDHLDFPTKFAISRFNNGRVFGDRDGSIGITHDVDQVYPCFGQRFERVNRVARVSANLARNGSIAVCRDAVNSSEFADKGRMDAENASMMTRRIIKLMDRLPGRFEID